MKRIIGFILCLAMIALLGSCASKRDLIGTWNLVSYSSGEGEIQVTGGTVLIFSEDGTGVKMVGGTLYFSFSYEYNGESIILKNIENVDGSTTEGSTQSISLSGSSLQITGGDTTANYTRAS